MWGGRRVEGGTQEREDGVEGDGPLRWWVFGGGHCMAQRRQRVAKRKRREKDGGSPGCVVVMGDGRGKGGGSDHILTKGPRHGPAAAALGPASQPLLLHVRRTEPKGPDQAVMRSFQKPARRSHKPKNQPIFFPTLHSTPHQSCAVFHAAAGIADPGWEGRTKEVDEHVDVVWG